MSKLLIIFLASFLSINCITEYKIDLNWTLNKMVTKEVGKKGTAIISFFCYAISDFKYTKRDLTFNSKLFGNGREYQTKCGLWKK